MGSLRTLKSHGSPFGYLRSGVTGEALVRQKEAQFRKFLREHDVEYQALVKKISIPNVLKEYDFYAILRLQQNQKDWMKRMQSVGASSRIIEKIGKISPLLEELVVLYYLRMMDFRFMSVQPLSSSTDTILFIDSENKIKSKTCLPKTIFMAGTWGPPYSANVPDYLIKESVGDYLLETTAESLDLGLQSIAETTRHVTWDASGGTLKSTLNDCFDRILEASGMSGDNNKKFAITSKKIINLFRKESDYLDLNPNNRLEGLLSGILYPRDVPIAVVRSGNLNRSSIENTVFLGVSGTDSWFDAPLVVAPHLICCLDSTHSNAQVVMKMKVEYVNPKQMLRLDVTD
jgi:hypothetical protein